MKVLVVGKGGREHALVWKLVQDVRIETVYAAPGNVGMTEAVCVPIREDAIEELVQFAREEQIDWTIVGPEGPLVLGIVNAFQAAGLKIFGPSREAAAIEGSKQFAKALMDRAGIPTADHAVFTSAAEATAYIRRQGAPIVVKADGLAAGKGVTVATTIEQAVQAIDEIFGGDFGQQSSVVIEECLVGEECSLMAFVHEETVIPMVLSQDHKRAFDGDSGPNTGGMGAYSPLPQFDEQAVTEEAMQRVLRPLVEQMASEGIPFTGFLYAGLMLTSRGPSVIEFNARFGDPETEVILPRLETELLDVIMPLMQGDIPEVAWSDEAVVGVVIAANGYPEQPVTGQPVPTDTIGSNLLVFHAGTAAGDDDVILSAGGRVLVCVAKAKDMKQAVASVYSGLDSFDRTGFFYRTDIAKKAFRTI
ncbi:phosphoribosylamine--glycine ligase [Exiguobacterium sibiricum 255-15]|uniref:Phosphoribosylamine--glycine ligase n=1 Tax=Exiguobacterium sibiricum (strain DSM 17290 / CCUG 55495 / CIP 109462 / JCM 13490 / 255-15) TaxID=262543 RepID=B1YJ10_EXIS2|nr:phosphoribosylamine--glycine ligase [Exiguobacterium sibiricum]ACB59940.1 phosphoribosylamine--glycine ligase [Exiguobacterium sibiricum 255-15]